MKTFEDKLKIRKEEERTFAKESSLGKIQDAISELKLRIEELEK